MRTLPISTFIIAKNEEDRISYTIKSVRDWVDEVIVIDSGSTDNTVTVSEELGARVVFHKWEGYGPQKKYGETLCRNSWLLNLDADEEISAELANEIKELFKAGEPEIKGYIFRIMLLYRFQKKLPFIGAGTKQLRLYNRDYAGFKDAYVHDSVVMKFGEARLLKNPVIHRCFRSHSHNIEKINFYSTMQAQDFFNRGRNPSTLLIIFTPVIAFFKSYFFRRYIFYGLDGFIYSWNYAFARLLRLAKARELFKEKEEEN